MAPVLLQFIHRLFSGRWKKKLESNKTFKRIGNNDCVLTSISSKENLSEISSFSCRNTSESALACSFESINFEFKEDLCCIRKCCDKCFCEEGEAIAKGVRKRGQRPNWSENKFLKPFSAALRRRSESLVSEESDVECATVSESSCGNLECCYREDCEGGTQNGFVPIQDFVSFHAQAVLNTDYEIVPPSYENVPVPAVLTDPPYDVVPIREPRAVDQTSSNYENVLAINCVDACVFKHISSIIDSTSNTLQVKEFLQELHKSYSCVRKTSSSDNEINYYFENYEEFENDLNLEIERQLSD